MEFPVPAYTSFTIPTGATTGARITFNENGNGKILVYNSSGLQVDSIGGPAGAVVSTNGDSTIDIESGQIFFTRANSNAAGTVVQAGGGVFQVTSGNATGSPKSDITAITLNAGQSGLNPGDPNGPKAVLGDLSLAAPTDLILSGSVISSAPNGVANTWQTPGYASGWAAGTICSGLGGNGLQFRIDAEDNVWLNGLVTASAGAGTIVFTLPAGYRPVNTPHGQILRDRSGVISIVEVAIVSAGSVIIGAPINAGDNYSFNFRIPRGNLP